MTNAVIELLAIFAGMCVVLSLAGVYLYFTGDDPDPLSTQDQEVDGDDRDQLQHTASFERPIECGARRAGARRLVLHGALPVPDWSADTQRLAPVGTGTPARRPEHPMSPRYVPDHWYDPIVVERWIAGRPTGRTLTHPERVELFRRYQRGSIDYSVLQRLGLPGRELQRCRLEALGE